MDNMVQSRAEQSRAEQSRAEQSRAEQSFTANSLSLKGADDVPELISDDNIIRQIYRKILPLSLRKSVRSIEKIFYDISLPVRLKFNLPLKKKLKTIHFEMHLTEHCNLNCKGCGHFSCIAEPEFLNIDEFERDFKRLGELFNHECHSIALLGGEPLLHSEIIKIMKTARGIFPKSVIRIATNGILLTKIGDDFWQSCRDYKIFISISDYPINIHLDKIKELAQKFDVNIFWNFGGSRENFLVFAMDLNGKEDYKRNFANCPQANACVTLKHGRLYTCPFAAHVHLFNKKFNQNIEITEKDYINIYAVNDKDEIFDRLRQAIPACRYCKLSARRETNWELSKQDINEWL